jgi:hypothetical protein
VILEFVLTFVALISSAGKNKLLFIGLEHLVPKGFTVQVLILVGEGLARRAREIFDGFIRLTTDYMLVAAICLGIGFL